MGMTYRREFLTKLGTGMGTLAAAPARAGARESGGARQTGPGTPGSAIDFRYAPLDWQTPFCFPDDPYKGLVGARGEFRYGHPGKTRGIAYFPITVGFAFRGMDPNATVRQRLEAPGVPIIHTRVECTQAYMHLMAFATNQPREGRVDNVILEVRPKTKTQVRVAPTVHITTRQEMTVTQQAGAAVVRLGGESAPVFLAANTRMTPGDDTGSGRILDLRAGQATSREPLRYLLRFPQQGQGFDAIQAGLAQPDALIAAAREYWRQWRPFGGPVTWRLPAPYQDFLVACARNLQTMRERVDGKLSFQVGPTLYRTYAVVDQHFILEAARYLGYDAEAQETLEATWAGQTAEGGIFANAGHQHWKDTGIASMTLVRQAELGQDWSYFRQMQSRVQRAFRFLMELRQKARAEGSANGRYGLLARGFADGGIGGLRSEFTNTVWVLAGLKSVCQAAAKVRLPGFEDAQRFHNDLRESFFAAARQEMRRHPAGFDYLPMLMKEDPQWNAADEWDRPRPQSAQWALSHAIFPGLVFEKDHPIVEGHIALMQACTQEDVPAETGWLPHEGVWPYNASFVAHVYLWAGLSDWATRTFEGFLNHASPLYCWREEQPVRGSLFARYIGDMPHNWGSAECIRYLRHMLALEDGSKLRLLAGIGDLELAMGEPYSVHQSPSRFGRMNLDLDPARGRHGWSLKFERGDGPEPSAVHLPARLGSMVKFSRLSGARFHREEDTITVDPAARSWTAAWQV